MHSIALICTFYWVTNSVDSETRFDFVGVCCVGGCSYLSVCLSHTTSARVPYLCLPPISSAKGVGVGLALVIQSSNSRFLGQYIWRHPLHIQKLKINTDNTHYITHCLAIPTTILYSHLDNSQTFQNNSSSFPKGFSLPSLCLYFSSQRPKIILRLFLLTYTCFLLFPRFSSFLFFLLFICLSYM